MCLFDNQAGKTHHDQCATVLKTQRSKMFFYGHYVTDMTAFLFYVVHFAKSVYPELYPELSKNNSQ